MNKNFLTVKEEIILNYIKDRIESDGFPPTIRDMCKDLKIRSTATVHYYLKKLENKGVILRQGNMNRAIKIVEEEDLVESKVEAVDIPVIGQVAAGVPILAEQNIEDYLPMPAHKLKNGTNFLLKVVGDSMIDAGIHDGDYVLVNEQNTANNGDMIVALIDGEATVKNLYKEKDHFRLQPQNSAFSPILTKDLHIVGVVHAVFRFFR